MGTPTEPLVIDGSHGEGGGQILRTALSLAAITGRAVRVERIRAGRPRPGLAAQHLTAVRSLVALCRAEVAGDAIGSPLLDFRPRAPVAAGDYRFDVGAAREGGSAGATTLMLQAVLLPLALAEGRSRLWIRGGTHMAWSPPYDYVAEVWLPLLAHIGIAARAELVASGWYPLGRGEIEVTVEGLGPRARARLRPIELVERGRILRIGGRALAANLPEQVAERMAARARALLVQADARIDIAAETVAAACPGAGLFLTIDCERVRVGFNVLGERGKRAEAVAEEAVAAFFRYRASAGALDIHLADQVLAPLAFAPTPSRFTTERVTGHLETNAWAIGRFGLAHIGIERGPGGEGLVTVEPAGAAGADLTGCGSART
ncbi:MAG: RNA 3'-phosphate cyclase [Proteobacteria bacterium]|nr:RNA 3'-phosphate cyclase [Pseudomonadota bacterium]